MERLNAKELILVTSEHHGPRAEFVCRAVMSARHLNFDIQMSTSEDLFIGKVPEKLKILKIKKPT